MSALDTHRDREPDSPRLFIVTAPVAGADEGSLPGDDRFDHRVVAQGTECLARERFHECCAKQNYEVLEEPTVEAITLEELLERVNDPDAGIGLISTSDVEPRSDSDST